MKKLFGTFVALAAILIAFTSCKKEGADVIKLKVSQIEIAVMGHQKIEVEKASGTIVWASKDINIASVDENGDVFGVAEGKTIVTATVGKASASVEVTVKAGGVTPPAAGISVTDNSIADWDKIPAEKVSTAICPDDAAYLGLKLAKVYADEVYINILVEYDPEEIPNHTLVPFHVYINTDNSDLTGGYGDEFTDANVDIMMEGFFFSAAEWDGDTPLDEGGPVDYDPVVVPWTGEVGGTGWGWGDELVPPAPFCATQHVGNFVELQMLRELIPTDAGWSDSEFGIGFDIQQSWESVGILPLVSPTDDNATGHTHKIQVKINK